MKKWPEIIRELHISSDCTSAATLLKRNYYRFLWSYELSQNAKNSNISDAEMKVSILFYVAHILRRLRKKQPSGQTTILFPTKVIFLSSMEFIVNRTGIR